ncbi:MAG: hypothetical protein Q9212_003941 [Teloschistes hypoglaucus]
MSLLTAGPEQRMMNPLGSLFSKGPSSTALPSMTIYNVFDGTSNHITTSTLPLTTLRPSTITTSATTRTISASTAVVSDYSHYPYPADGCWDDPKCWHSKTRSEPTAAPTANAMAKGHDGSSRPAAGRFLKEKWPFVAAGMGGLVILVALILGAWFWVRGRKQQRSARAEQRQIKRISSGANSVEGGRNGNGNGNVEAPIELGEMGEPRSAAGHERDEEISPAPDPGVWFRGRGGV